MYSSDLSLTSALDRGVWLMSRSVRFNPIELPGTHCTAGRVGPRTILDEC